MFAFGGKADMASVSQNVRLWPKADMCSATQHVRFVPEADMLTINEFVGAGEERVRDSNAYCT